MVLPSKLVDGQPRLRQQPLELTLIQVVFLMIKKKNKKFQGGPLISYGGCFNSASFKTIFNLQRTGVLLL